MVLHQMDAVEGENVPEERPKGLGEALWVWVNRGFLSASNYDENLVYRPCNRIIWAVNWMAGVGRLACSYQSGPTPASERLQARS